MKPYSNPTSLRVFLAVELSSNLRKKVAELQRELRGTLPTINWVHPESIHLTLKFLGYIAPAMVEQLLTAIEPIRKRQTSIMVEIQGLGVFPHIHRPRILWIGCTGDMPSLLNCVSRIEGTLEAFGFPPEEKPYHPHLTLARIKHDNSKVGNLLAHSGLLEQPRSLGPWHIDRITLFRSDLSPKGVAYTALWTVPLIEAGSGPSI